MESRSDKTGSYIEDEKIRVELDRCVEGLTDEQSKKFYGLLNLIRVGSFNPEHPGPVSISLSKRLELAQGVADGNYEILREGIQNQQAKKPLVVDAVFSKKTSVSSTRRWEGTYASHVAEALEEKEG